MEGGIEPERIVFDQGRLAAEPGWLYVDCSASGVKGASRQPVECGGVFRVSYPGIDRW